MSGNAKFESWLKNTLIKLNTDDEVFSPYILGILNSDEPLDEQTESLTGILAGITDTGIEELCSEILSKWGSATTSKPVEPENKRDDALNAQLEKLMGKEAASLLPLAAQKKVNKEQQDLKKAILSQYSQVSVEEEVSEEDEPKGAAGGGKIFKNTNAASVDDEVKQQREQNKEEHRQRKQKDKEDRDKQKAKVDERKEKEKKRTMKGEKRR